MSGKLHTWFCLDSSTHPESSIRVHGSSSQTPSSKGEPIVHLHWRLAASTPGFLVFNPAAPTQGRSHLFQLQRRPSSTPHPPRHREIEALRVVMSDCLLFNSCGTRVFEMEGLSGMVESKSSATLVRLQLPLQLPRQFSSHTGFISVHPEDLQLNLTSHLSEQLQLFPLLSRANQTTSL